MNNYINFDDICFIYSKGQIPDEGYITESQLAHLAYTNTDDIVKITKCKDCKYFHTHHCSADNTGIHTYCELNILGYNENDYCSCALPKEN